MMLEGGGRRSRLLNAARHRGIMCHEGGLALAGTHGFVGQARPGRKGLYYSTIEKTDEAS